MGGLNHGLELGIVLAESFEEENGMQVVAVKQTDCENLGV